MMIYEKSDNRDLYHYQFMDCVKYIISNVICYTKLYMLEWMQKEKHRIGTQKT